MPRAAEPHIEPESWLGDGVSPRAGFVVGSAVAASVLALGWGATLWVLGSGVLVAAIVGAASGRLDVRGAIRALLRRGRD